MQNVTLQNRKDSAKCRDICCVIIIIFRTRIVLIKTPKHQNKTTKTKKKNKRVRKKETEAEGNKGTKWNKYERIVRYKSEKRTAGQERFSKIVLLKPI